MLQMRINTSNTSLPFPPREESLTGLLNVRQGGKHAWCFISLLSQMLCISSKQIVLQEKSVFGELNQKLEKCKEAMWPDLSHAYYFISIKLDILSSI